MRRGQALISALLGGALLPGCISWLASPRPAEEFERHQRILASEEAEEAAERARWLEGASFEERILEADRQMRVGKLDRAVVGYIEALQADPKNPVPRARIANIHLRDDPDRAAAIFRELLEQQPDLALAHAGLGLALLARNRIEEAEASLSRAAELDPELATARYGLSVVYDLTGRHVEAKRHALRARELRPNDATIANNLGVSYLLTGDLQEAERAFRTASFLDPNDPAVRNNLGLVLGRQGHYAAALEEFRRFGSEQAAHNNLGYVYLLNGRFDQAIAHFERALQAEGDDRLVVLRNLNAALDARGAQAQPAADLRP